MVKVEELPPWQGWAAWEASQHPKAAADDVLDAAWSEEEGEPEPYPDDDASLGDSG